MKHSKPPRMCVITRKVLSQEERIRIVRTPEGKVVLDIEETLSGRGMYIQKNNKSIAQLFEPKKRGLWKHALKADISENEKGNMLEQLQDYLRN